MAGPDRDPPPDQPNPASNVVPIGAANSGKRRPATPKPASAVMPDATGVGAMQGDPLLTNLRESCLDDSTIDAARLFTLPSSKWRAYGFRSAARPQSGLLIPFFEPGAVEPYDFRIKPQHPIPVKGRNGKIKLKKYDQRGGAGVSLVYTPPLPATLTAAQDISTPLVWTEGEKKALLLAQLGHCVVGLTGVDMWHDIAAKANDGATKLHPHIARRYAVAGRAHVIVFDADARSPHKPNIMLAVRKLAGVLRALGAASVHLCLPPDAGDAKGIDDYAHKHGLEACAQLLSTVREPIDDIDPDLGCLPLSHFGDWYTGSGAEHLRMPRGYETERDGSLWHTEDLARPEERKLVVEAPIVIARELKSLHTGELRLEVKFRDRCGVWRSVVVPREVTGSQRELVAALRPLGALVDASSSSGVMKYLTAFERDNGALIEQALCASQTGWHRGQFVTGGAPLMPASGAQPIQLDGSPELLRIAAVVQPAPRSDVQAHVAALATACGESPECALVVYAALAAPLLHLLGVGNFAVHLSGDSSRGKTSMLRIAASVFGDPRSANWVASWNATLAGLEQRATLLNDLPQFYDEVGVASFELVQQMVYTLINGEGRTRSTREATARHTPRWRTVVLSTGERELVSETDPTGAQARVIGVSVHGFGTLGARDIDAVVRACTAHYGALGRAWLEYLVGMTDEQIDALRDAHDAIASNLRAQSGPSNPLAQRSAAFFAAMALAEAEVSAGWGLGAEGGATVFEVAGERMRAASGDDDHGQRVRPLAERIVDALRDWTASAPGCFPMCNAVPEMATRVHGYRKADGTVAFIPRELRTYLTSVGLPMTRAVVTELVSQRWLLPEPGSARPDGRVYIASASKNINARIRAYTFRLADGS